MRRFEFDPSWLVIRGLAAVGLAEIVGAPVRLAEPRAVDL
jgi:fatty-acid desaturase